MTIYSLPRLTRETSLPEGCVVALGYFDGVHLGHRAIIDVARRVSESRGVPVAVWLIASGDPCYKKGTLQLTSEEEKLALLHKAGAAFAAISSFSEIKELSGEDFVRRVLKESLRASSVVCGFNFRFGRGASCDVEALERLCKAQGIDTVACSAVKDECGESISSTRIRAAITDGEVKKAALMLGRPYSFTAPVVHGKKLGRVLGFPTANQSFPDGKLSPPNSVYAVAVEFYEGGKLFSYPGAANIGSCPTVTESSLSDAGIDLNSPYTQTKTVCETYIAGYEGELYGKEITLRFLERIRSEMKFDSIDALTAQISADAEVCRRVYYEIYGSSKQ